MANPTADQAAPPRDSVWTKYSPNHECPLASATSLALHGLLAAGVLLSGLALQARWHGEAYAPPKLDVVFVKAADGDGQLRGGGSDPGTPGSQTEHTEVKLPAKNAIDASVPPLIEPMPPSKVDVKIDVPMIGVLPETPNLQNAFKEIEKNFIPSPEAKPRIVVPKNAGAGGGQGGGGVGTGKGPDVGPGGGIGGIPGGATTQAEIYAKRWRFDPKGEPKEHLKKLLTAGITLGFEDGNNLFWMIRDLKRRPVALQRESLEKYKDSVMWENRDQASILGLAHELGLLGPPRRFIMLLPFEREQAFANAEMQFAKKQNNDLGLVEETWFDFRAVGGSFEPVVLGQVMRRK